MSNQRVYLSISNKVLPHVRGRVAEYISGLFDVELWGWADVARHVGTTDAAIILSKISDKGFFSQMIVVPPVNLGADVYCTIGKGQHEEISSFIVYNDYEDVFIVHETAHLNKHDVKIKNLYLSSLLCYDCIQEDWQTRYTELQVCDDEYINMECCFSYTDGEPVFPKRTHTEIIGNGPKVDEHHSVSLLLYRV